MIIATDMHPRLTVSALSSWDSTLHEDLALWASGGITAVGIWADKLRSEVAPDRIAHIKASGLRVGNLIAAGPFTLNDPSRWPLEREQLLQYYATATALGAPVISLTSGPSQGLDWDVAVEALSAALEPVLWAEGPVLAIEHTHALRVDVGFVHRLADAVDLARALGIGVCMECNACWAERDLYKTVESSTDVIRLVQVSDFSIGTRDTPNRLVPGDGDIPLRRMLGALINSGYEGDFDLEIVGPRIEAEGYGPAIERSIKYLTAVLTDVGA